MAQNGEETPRWGLSRALAAMASRFRGRPDIVQPRQPAPLRAYVARKRSLPDTFTERDWQRALEYWGYKCAVCGRPRGLWHTLAADHWIPLTSPDCPGTIPTNIIPLCHGEGGCNNSKRSKMPEVWLISKLGKKDGSQKLVEIDIYFLWVKDLLTDRLGCWNCGEPVMYSSHDEVWLCTYCNAEWTTEEARSFLRCPRCQCWMVDYEGMAFCGRCHTAWAAAELPPPDSCATCGKQTLQWEYDPGGPASGWWHCTACKADWVFEWA